MNYFGSFGRSENEALKTLEPILSKALLAHIEGDFEAYSALISEELASMISESKFKKAHREIQPQLGELVSKKFIASLKKGDNPMLLFSAKYTATLDDVLINVTFKNKTSPPKIDWLWIE